MVDLCECVRQYLVASYMTAPACDRADAVDDGIEAISGAATILEPNRALKRAALEPLPDFDAFVIDWHALVQRWCARKRAQGREDIGESIRLREAVKWRAFYA